MRRLLAATTRCLLVPLGLAGLLALRADAQAACSFRLGFAALAAQIPDIVGTCLEDERFNPANGNAEQRTTAWHGKGGLLVWRRADNWTAFTDGATTWINGPHGLQRRPNGERFDWEAAPTAPTTGLAPGQAASPGGPEPMCGIDNFAWTVKGALARGAQPPDDAWPCLRRNGFTTVIRQNVEDGDRGEAAGVAAAGMAYVGRYQIPDQTAYPPAQIEAMLADVAARLRRGEVVLVHDAGGRGRMGFWEAAFLLWRGWSAREAIDRYVAFGWKIDCDKGGNGQMQAINELAAARGQPPYYPPRDSYGTPWGGCPRPAYMAGWSYAGMRWPTDGP